MTAMTPPPRGWLPAARETSSALAVSVVMAPQQSVLSLLLQAASGISLGAPADLLAGISKALRPQARFALRPLTASGHISVPEFCVPISPLTDTSVTEQARRLRDLPAEVVTGELTAYGDHHFPPGWQAAGQQPRCWLNSMADASLDTWAVIEPWWRAAEPLFDREMRRVGTAAVRGGLGTLLNSLHPMLSYRDGTLTLAHPCDQCVPLGRRRLVLLPMIAGRDSLLVSFERDDVCYVGYSTATYHVHLLADAGLVTCERRGSSVLVSRSARGHELVDLLAD
jgi:hypothetical protein